MLFYVMYMLCYVMFILLFWGETESKVTRLREEAEEDFDDKGHEKDRKEKESKGETGREWSQQTKIKVGGREKGKKKENLFRRCDVFALTSHSEGFSVSLLEALSYGKPAVISEGCHFEDVGTHSAGFVTPVAPEPIAQSLNVLLNDDLLRERMSANAVSLIEEKYTWDTIADQTVNFYRHTLSASKWSC